LFLACVSSAWSAVTRGDGVGTPAFKVKSLHRKRCHKRKARVSHLTQPSNSGSHKWCDVADG
jgi:hypothetical protein